MGPGRGTWAAAGKGLQRRLPLGLGILPQGLGPGRGSSYLRGEAPDPGGGGGSGCGTRALPRLLHHNIPRPGARGPRGRAPSGGGARGGGAPSWARRGHERASPSGAALAAACLGGLHPCTPHASPLPAPGSPGPLPTPTPQSTTMPQTHPASCRALAPRSRGARRRRGWSPRGSGRGGAAAAGGARRRRPAGLLRQHCLTSWWGGEEDAALVIRIARGY